MVYLSPVKKKIEKLKELKKIQSLKIFNVDENSNEKKCYLKIFKLTAIFIFVGDHMCPMRVSRDKKHVHFFLNIIARYQKMFSTINIMPNECIFI